MGWRPTITRSRRNERFALLTGLAAACLGLTLLAVPASAGVSPPSPQTLSGAGQEARFPQLATDGSGRATVTWTSYDFFNERIQSVRLDADGTADPVQTLSDPGQSPTVPQARIPQVAIDGSDRATIAWQRADGSDFRIEAARLDANGAPGPVQALSDPGQNARFAQVAIDGSDRATITWQRSDSRTYRIQSARLDADGTPGPVQTLSDAGRSAINPQVAIDGSDRATIVWQGPHGFLQLSRIQSVRLDADGTADPVQTLSEAGQSAISPQIAIDDSGRATVVWRRSDGANARIQSVHLGADGTPGAVQTLSEPGRNAFFPQIAIDDSDRATITWQSFDGSNTRIQSVRLGADGTPGAVQALSEAGQDASQPQIAIDSSNRATITWRRSDGTNTRIESVRLAADGTRGAVQTLSEAGQDASDPRIAIDSSDRATIIWQRSDGVARRIQSVTLDMDLKGFASAKKAQKQGKKIIVKAKVKANEDLDAKGSGKVEFGSNSYRLRPRTKSVPSGKSKNLKLKPKKSKDAKRIAKALKKGKRATAKLTVKLADAAGNKKTKKLSVKLKR
jgi:hypothetical protein